MNIVVESAVALDATQTKELEGVLKKKVNGKFTVEYVVSEQILGGLRITIDSKRIDFSLQGKLDQVKKAL